MTGAAGGSGVRTGSTVVLDTLGGGSGILTSATVGAELVVGAGTGLVTGVGLDVLGTGATVIVPTGFLDPR